MRTTVPRLAPALVFPSLLWLLPLNPGPIMALPQPFSQVTEGTAESHFLRASKLAEQGKLDEAEREYRTGLRITPSPEAHNNLGVIYFKRRKLAQAVEAFEHARRLEPQNAEFSFNLGLALFQQGNNAAAIPRLAAGASAPDHATDPHVLLGACSLDLKQWQPSIAALEVARREQPQRAETLFLLVRAYAKADRP